MVAIFECNESRTVSDTMLNSATTLGTALKGTTSSHLEVHIIIIHNSVRMYF